MAGDVLVDRGVVALQDPAGQLDADEEADDGGQAVGCPGRAARSGDRRPLSVAIGEALDKAAVPVDAVEERVDAEVLVVGVERRRCSLLIRNGANR